MPLSNLSPLPQSQSPLQNPYYEKWKEATISRFKIILLFLQAFPGGGICFAQLWVVLLTMTTQMEKIKSTKDWISSFDYVIPRLQIKPEKSSHDTEHSTLTLKVYIWSN